MRSGGTGWGRDRAWAGCESGASSGAPCTYLVVDSVEQARHGGEDVGLECLDVVGQLLDVTAEEADPGAVLQHHVLSKQQDITVKDCRMNITH